MTIKVLELFGGIVVNVLEGILKNLLGGENG